MRYASTSLSPASAAPAHVAQPAAAVGVDLLAEDLLAGALAQFRAATRQYVFALRAGGVRPEQTLARVQAFVREAMAAEGWSDPETVQALTAQAAGWSIAAYHDR